MNVILWIAALLLALIVVSAGVEKLITPIDDLRARRAWTRSHRGAEVRLLGAAEVLGAIGLILPAITGIYPVLVSVAAGCLAVLMVGAITTEIRVHPSVSRLALPALTLMLAIVVAVGRAGPYAF
jgi:DoxX-like family